MIDSVAVICVVVVDAAAAATIMKEKVMIVRDSSTSNRGRSQQPFPRLLRRPVAIIHGVLMGYG